MRHIPRHLAHTLEGQLKRDGRDQWRGARQLSLCLRFLMDTRHYQLGEVPRMDGLMTGELVRLQLCV